MVDQQGDDRVLELGLPLELVRQGVHRVDDDAGEPRGVQQALLQVELPRTLLLRHQTALKQVGEARDDALEMCQLLVEVLALPRQFLRIAERSEDSRGGKEWVSTGRCGC